MPLLQKLVSRLHAARVGSPAAPASVVPASSSASRERARIIDASGALLEKGAFAESLALVDEALTGTPDDRDLLFARAAVLFAWGRHAEARALLIRLEQAGQRNAQVLVKLGWACFWLGRTDEAAESMRKAILLQSDDWSTHFGWATTQRAKKRTAAAKAAFERALALHPDERHCISNLVACEVELDHLDAAERHARGALARDPKSSSAWIDLGIVLCSQARYAEAVGAFERADALEFSSIDARDESVNYAICLLRAGRPQQAMTMMEAKLRLHPSGALHYHYALALLTAGWMREGWEHYEFRWLQEPLLSWRPAFAKPLWRGEDLRGKTILLRAEQGYGDFIQFIRYAPHVKALGARVLLEVRAELADLARQVSSIDRVLGSGEAYPDFDCYINLLSVPRIFGTELDTIPAEVPYLHVPADRAAAWKDAVGRDAKLNVGLVWAGSPTHLGDRFRSLPLRALAPLRELAGVRFFSLQKGPASAELVTDHGYDPIVDLGPRLRTFADTAAAIDRLDLVIGVDTAVVHLAGALGKPVWTLVAIPGDWRWLETRDDSPWYPTMRLFRQHEPGDWNDVVARLKRALQIEVDARAGDVILDDSTARAATALAAIRPMTPAAPGVPHDLHRIAETRAGIMIYDPRDASTAKSIELYGECAQLQLDAFARLLRPGMTVMEVAAGIGAHAIPIASILGPEGHLFLYEDGPLLKHVLRENLKANRVSNATLMRRSLSRIVDRSSRASPRPPVSGMERNAPEEPELETIDALRLEQLHWLRIDEGVDAAAVIRGAQATIWRLRPGLFIAFDDARALATAAAHARDLGYACWRLETPLFNPGNFNRHADDVFAGRTSLALIGVPEESEFEVPLEGCSRLA
jgi:tetratricopeptide (TPR) repeat protein